jgi:hypothetical protein
VNRDQILLQEAYQSIYESVVKPLYFGPKEDKDKWFKWLRKLKPEVHEDGSVSINGEVSFMRNNRGQIDTFDNLGKYVVSRLPFNFQKVTGGFYCPNRLMNLTGSPRYVGGHFNCGSDNPNMSSLVGAPDYVGGDFWCQSSRIKSLEGAPEVVKGDFESTYFEDKDYREFVRERKIKQKVDKELDKDLNVDLGDFS